MSDKDLEFDDLPAAVRDKLVKGGTVEIDGQKYKAVMYLEEEIIKANGKVEKLKGGFENGLTRNR